LDRQDWQKRGPTSRTCSPGPREKTRPRVRGRAAVLLHPRPSGLLARPRRGHPVLPPAQAGHLLRQQPDYGDGSGASPRTSSRAVSPLGRHHPPVQYAQVQVGRQRVLRGRLPPGSGPAAGRLLRRGLRPGGRGLVLLCLAEGSGGSENRRGAFPRVRMLVAGVVRAGDGVIGPTPRPLTATGPHPHTDPAPPLSPFGDGWWRPPAPIVTQAKARSRGHERRRLPTRTITDTSTSLVPDGCRPPRAQTALCSPGFRDPCRLVRQVNEFSG
jgi:hypothetical protein